jgi:hypothetical protein
MPDVTTGRLAIPEWVYASILGLAGLIAVVGLRPLDPTNIRWLADSDPLKDYLSWAFFRHAPWGLPLGANPNFGLDKLGSSVLFSNSIPLFALVFKAFRAVLPEPFQYLGLWMLVSFLLQSYFAWRLLSAVTSDLAARISGTLLFVFAPPLMMRAGVHHDLVEQWVLLAALWLYVQPPARPMLAWSLLSVVTALSHPYLLAMVLALWAAGWAGRWMADEGSRPLLAAEGAIVALGCAVALWQSGAFLIGRGVGREGFAYYRMNVNALLNPRVDPVSRWSYVMPALSGVSPGEYEGFSFLGLGALACFVAALGTVPAHRDRLRAAFRRRWIPLWLVCAGFTLLALSNQVSVGSHELSYPLPESVLRGLSVFRASGRFFLPVFYLIVFISIAQVLWSFSRQVAGILLAVFALMQIVDTSAGWLPRRERLDTRHGRTFSTPLRDPFWSQAGPLYRILHMVRWGSLRGDWAVFAIYADQYRMSTDSVYLTRVDEDRLASVESQQLEQLGRGQFEPRSMYVLDHDVAAIVAGRIDPAVDLLASIDGFWVLAPRWHTLRPDH